ncbi:MAG: hypothetical protein JST17_04095 [Bacteroidetes bacterium]|nr:hypothetical protein [Bacteroidota bacterium]MBS1929590.1 hypothetical protein [Bacteroidota bacterium]
MKYLFKIFLSLAGCLLLAKTKLQAQPFNLDDRVVPVQLNLVDYKKDNPKEKGRINVTDVSQEKEDTMYFFVQGLSMYSPTYFSINSADPTVPINVRLCKDNWHQFDREGQTDEKGQWHVNFKTEGDYGIMVIPQTKPAKYTLLTWSGDEAKNIGMTSPFKAGSVDSAASKGFLQQYLWYIVGGVVLLILIFFFLAKRKTKK